jgi:hypothetical protein
MALRATMMLDPDMLSAEIAGLRVKPAGSRMPAAIGMARLLSGHRGVPDYSI